MPTAIPTSAPRESKLNDPPTWWEKVKAWVNEHIVQPVKRWVENKIDQTWPAMRATGPGENGINLVNKHREVIIGTVSSFNSLVKSTGGFPYQYEKKPGKFEERRHSVTVHPTSIAISLSIQGESPQFIEIAQWLLRPLGQLLGIDALAKPSYGMAQIGPDQYDLIKHNIQQYVNLDGVSDNPYFALNQPQVATAAMIERIAPYIELCEEYKCKPTDREIIIGVNQNGDGGFSEKDLRNYFKDEIYHASNGPTLIDWQKIFNERTIKDGGWYEDFLNWRASGHNFDTWFMLNRYYNNAMAFEASGQWSMPQGVDWEYIKSLIENTPPSSQWK